MKLIADNIVFLAGKDPVSLDNSLFRLSPEKMRAACFLKKAGEL